MKKPLIRYIPEGCTTIDYPELNAVVYIKDRKAMVYTGTNRKPDFYFIFPNTEERDTYVKNYIEGLQREADEKKRRKEERANYTHTFQVDDILSSLWGYEQTNVYFYQVVKVSSPKTIVIRRIKSGIVDEDHYQMTGHVVPVPSAFIEDVEPLQRRVFPGDIVNINSYAIAQRWNGTPETFTNYA